MIAIRYNSLENISTSNCDQAGYFSSCGTFQQYVTKILLQKQNLDPREVRGESLEERFVDDVVFWRYARQVLSSSLFVLRLSSSGYCTPQRCLNQPFSSNITLNLINLALSTLVYRLTALNLSPLSQVTNSFGAKLYVLETDCRALFTDPDLATVLHDDHWKKYSGKQTPVFSLLKL